MERTLLICIATLLEGIGIGAEISHGSAWLQYPPIISGIVLVVIRFAFELGKVWED